MPSSSVARLRDDFAAWAEGHGDGLEIDVVDTMLELKRDQLGDPNPGRWTEEHLQVLLLEALPRKVTADDEWVSAVVPTLHAFLRFADQTARMHRSSAPLSRLVATLHDLEPRLVKAMHDTSRFGPAKLISSLMQQDGVALDDEAAVRRWIAEFNDRPFQDRLAATGGPSPTQADRGAAPAVTGEAFPAVRIAPVPELAAAARTSRLIGTAVRLAEWVGPRRQVTATGVLRLQEGRQASRELGLDDSQRLAERERWSPVRSSRDLRGLHRVWTLATEIELLDVSASRVYPGPALRAWHAGDDEAVLELWQDAFTVVLEQGSGAGLEQRLPFTGAAVDEELPEVLVGLFAVRDGLRWPDLVEGLHETAEGFGVRLDEHMREWLAEDLRASLDRWADLGLAAWSGETLTMTPLGLWGVREGLVEAGADVPLVPDTRSLDAEAMLEALSQMDDADARVERGAWLGSRSAQDAARQLLAAAGSTTPRLRGLASLLLETQLPVDAVAPAMRAALEDSTTRPFAASWLERHGEPVRVATMDRLWLLVDSTAAVLEELDREDLDHEAEALLWKAFGQPGVLDAAWRCEHPETADVLHSVGRRHPDKAVAKAARKAAFKARS